MFVAHRKIVSISRRQRCWTTKSAISAVKKSRSAKTRHASRIRRSERLDTSIFTSEGAAIVIGDFCVTGSPGRSESRKQGIISSPSRGVRLKQVKLDQAGPQS